MKQHVLHIYTGPQCPHDYGTGYFTAYSSEAWESWLKSFSMQTGTEYKICTGKNVNKESNTGVLQMNGKSLLYKVLWQKQYMCHRGGKARYCTKVVTKKILNHAMPLEQGSQSAKQH